MSGKSGEITGIPINGPVIMYSDKKSFVINIIPIYFLYFRKFWTFYLVNYKNEKINHLPQNKRFVFALQFCI
jgi:hypothetical protein